MLLGFGYLYVRYVLFLFFLKKQKTIDFEKASWPKFFNICYFFAFA